MIDHPGGGALPQIRERFWYSVPILNRIAGGRMHLMFDNVAAGNPATKDGADVNHPLTDTGQTPLHRAAAFGNEEDIRSLLDAGGKVEALDANGDSPLSWASWHLRPGAVLWLLCYGPHYIHPERRKETTCEAATGSMEKELLGHPQL